VASGGVVLLALLTPTLPYLLARVRCWLDGGARTSVTPHIGPLHEDDLPSLDALCECETCWADMVDDSDVVVLELIADTEVIGVAAGCLTPSDAAEILLIYVTPEWRRRYWGSALLAELRVQLQACGAEQLNMPVDAENKQALNFMLSQPWQRARITFR
jgi:ribosomal protein S18 acetylase RimI-like enzyme